LEEGKEGGGGGWGNEWDGWGGGGEEEVRGGRGGGGSSDGGPTPSNLGEVWFFEVSHSVKKGTGGERTDDAKKGIFNAHDRNQK